MFNRKKKKIQDIEKRIEILDQEYSDQVKRLIRRLRRAGMLGMYDYLDTEQVKTAEIEIEPIPYGTYVVLSGGTATKDQEEQAKKIVAEKIAAGLMQQEMIQFICKDNCADFDPLSQYSTVAAKIRVVPWEQMTRSIRVPLV